MNKTIRDVAALAGVSPSTVSRVLNKSGYVSKQTQQNVMKAIEKMSYSPSAIAVSLSRNRSNMIGILVPSIYNEFFIDVINAVEKMAEEQGFRMMLCSTDYNLEKEKAALEDLLAYRVVGLIIIPNRIQEKDNVGLLNQILSNGTPVICVDQKIPRFIGDNIYIDNDPGLEELLESILERGHRRIAALLDTKSIPAGSSISKIDTDRIKTIRRVLEAHQLELPEEHILRVPCTNSDSFAVLRRLVEHSKRPSALLTLSSKATVCAVAGLASCGVKIPQDILVAGYDDSHVLEAFHYSIQYSPTPAELGTLAAQTLFQRLRASEQKLPYQHITIPSRMELVK